MPVLDPRQTSSSLRTKGFKLVEKHHHFFEFWVNNKMVARTRMSHNNQEINSYLIGQMSRQCHLTRNDFIALVECPLTKDGYIKKLKDQGII